MPTSSGDCSPGTSGTRGYKHGWRWENLAGQKFGLLTVTDEWAIRRGSGNRLRPYWKVVCACGQVSWATPSVLKAGHKKSCGCLWYKGSLPKGVSEFNARMRAYVHGAKKRGISWGLTRAEFERVVTGNCYYCGQPAPLKRFRLKKGRWGAHVNGIDRKDSELGYEVSNVVPCCSKCNRAKGTLPIKEFLLLCQAVARNCGDQNVDTQ